jgi:hypothetical protein
VQTELCRPELKIVGALDALVEQIESWYSAELQRRKAAAPSAAAPKGKQPTAEQIANRRMDSTQLLHVCAVRCNVMESDVCCVHACSV